MSIKGKKKPATEATRAEKTVKAAKTQKIKAKDSSPLSLGDKLDYTVLFILNAAGMILELVASRLLSPYFGSSNFVWTAIIGIILLAGSLGNILGGKLASARHHRLIMSLLLIFTAIYLAATPLVDAPILTGIKAARYGTEFAAVISSIIFFLIPSTVLGIITPIIMKEHIKKAKDSGKESGRITAIIAIGSLVGTFAGGFWLIPAVGTKMMFILLAAIILICAILFRPLQKLENSRSTWLISLAIIISFAAILAATVSVARTDDSATTESGISIDTEYGRIIIEDGEYSGMPARFYKQSGAYSSATFTDPAHKYELVYPYIKKYDHMFDFTDVKTTAMIGGAAYQYPKYFISTFPDKSMDVIEIDPASTDIAKKYFYLDDLIADYGTERLGLYNEDGRVFMSRGEQKYDAILNDAFSGEVPVGTLATTEAAAAIKSKLNPGGVYMSNVIGALEGSRAKFLRAEVKTLSQVFRHVYVIPVHDGAKPTDYTNWMVIATDGDHLPADAVDLGSLDDAIILTDDYCPIDSLISTYYHDN
ncbi:fused MFS/spermidine synthase [Candidatus Saccharibacteria bacterium]|nr:fused MFS/spermidine synthase [Candidatus Saccharibacteria bacterium]